MKLKEEPSLVIGVPPNWGYLLGVRIIRITLLGSPLHGADQFDAAILFAQTRSWKSLPSP